MIELVIERWGNRDGSVDYRWSLWQEGRRLQMGGTHRSGEACEAEALAFCRARLGGDPDRITRL